MLVYICSFVVMMISGLFVFVSKRKHLLLMLLSLEFIVLCNYMNLYLFLSMNYYELFFSMIYLVMSVCEGVLGLAVLVSMIRTCGNDYILNFSILW
uniref:NADH dehydrogenase subunit 4L n=1 Tax=Distenia punctulatoides TaxID=2980435 RepID=UPI0021D539D9|nr:NADH dehydrogenase subunit 4L [Distenia punctulatoides]UXG19100.1 NADH dehydrogenase subunit 4L [Distenia punctulatoides]